MDRDVKLERSLGLSSVVLFGLAYMTPMIVFGTFGALATTSQGLSAMAYALASGAILLTAISYGIMSQVYPVAGSAYTYARKSLNAHLGFLVGWAVLLDYFFLPMVIWLIGAAYLSSAFPGIPSWIWIVGFILLTTLVNVAGISFASRVNFVLMVVQLVVVVIFVAMAVRYVMAANGPGGLISIKPFFNADVPFSAAVSGAALAAYSFLGFDAVSTLTEESRIRATGEAMRAAGAIIDEVPVNWTRAINDLWSDTWCVFMSAFFSDALKTYRNRMDPAVVGLIERGFTLEATSYKRIEVLRTSIWRDPAALIKTYDALLCPTCVVAAPAVTETDDDYMASLPDGRFRGLDMTCPFNLVPQSPAVSLPVGLQIVGRRYADEDVLGLALAVEKVLGTLDRPLPLHS